MKRKSILCGGIFLIIFYSLAFIASVALGAGSAIYFFVNDTIQIVNSLLLPIIQPFLKIGQIALLIIVGAAIVFSLLMLIGSSRFIKHSFSSVEVYSKKKKLLIFFFVLGAVLFAGFCYLLVSSMMGGNFMKNIIVNGLLIFAVLVHLVSLLLIFLGLYKYKGAVTYVAPTEANPEQEQTAQATEEMVKPTKPAIYTSGLDPDEEQKPTLVRPTTPNPAVAPKAAPVQARGVEGDNTRKLIEAIGVLDQKRKEGSITMEEYTRLRAQMIRRLTK